MMMCTSSTTGVMKHKRPLLCLVSSTGLFAGSVHFIDFVPAGMISLSGTRTAAGNWVLAAIVLVVARGWINRILEPGREWHTHCCRFVRNSGLFVYTQ
ncbi:hypothetical protein QL093DRAFT_2198175 [Fusarium oxysporum]|nr:hypothetical protein QL093DRAFT_2198175 [Fusarium oxysporum]